MWGRNGNLQVITCCSKCQSHWNIAAPLRNYPHHSNRIYTSKWQKIDLGGQFLALLRCKSLSVVIMHCFYPCLWWKNIYYCLFSVLEAMNGGVGAGLFAPVGLDRVSPGMVIDVASLILQGFHAVPVKLKMLLDRLFSLLSPEEITAVLRSFGWSIQDYQRGYILKVGENCRCLLATHE